MSIQLDQILGLFNQNEISALSQQTGLDENKTADVVQQVVPTLLSGIQNNLSSNGISGFLSALDKDHDGSVLDDLAGFFQNGGNTQGNGILNHVLGEQRSNVENALAENNGVSAGSIAKLLPLIAPIVMGYLGKQKKEGGFDASSIVNIIGKFTSGNKAGGLDIGSILGMLTNNKQSGQTATAEQPSAAGGILGMIGKLFGK